MTIRVFSRTRVAGRCGGIAALCFAALALLAAPARAQDTVFRSTVTVGAGPTLPVGALHPFDDPGSTYLAAIAVGDDGSTVGLALGFTVFDAGLFESRGASVSQFELRADCAPFAPNKLSPFLRVGAGAHNVDIDRSQNDGTSRRVGVSTGVGVRWSPRWDSALTLVASYYNVPARGESTRQWVAVTLELMRWMD